MGEALNKKRKVRSMSFFYNGWIVKSINFQFEAFKFFFLRRDEGQHYRNEQEIQPKFYSLFKSASVGYTVYRVK